MMMGQKHHFAGKWYKGYRSPGKAIGKGLNYWGEDDYIAAWGSEMDYYNYDQDDDHNYYYHYYRPTYYVLRTAY